MNSLAQTLTESNPIAAIATAYAETGARFVTIHKNETGKVILYRTQRDQLVVQHFPRTLPAMSTGTLVLQNHDGRQADESAVREWLAETAELMGEPAPALASANAPVIEAAATPAPTCPLEQAAADLLATTSDRLPAAQQRKLAARVEKAVELAQAGLIRFPHYQTSYTPKGLYGARNCNCGDAKHRGLHVIPVGLACKHTLAQYLAERVDADAEAIAYRRHIDKLESHGRRNLPTISPEQAEEIKQDIDRDAALPASVDNRGSILDMLGYEPETRSIEEQKREARASLGHARQADQINKSRAGAGRAQFGRYTGEGR